VEERIVQLEHLSSVKRVITVDEPDDFAICTFFMYFFKNVLHGFLVYVVDNDFDFVLGNVFLLDVLFDKVSSLVRGVVINVHDVVILVILHEEGVEISEVKSVFNIVVRRHYDAEPELMIFVIFDVVMLIIEFFFHLHDFFDSLCFGFFF
jgi:hypothetical protein